MTADADGPRPGMSKGRDGDEPHQATRRMMAQASRRLSILEYVFLLAAVVLALLGGALAAWGLQAGLGLPFRLTWAVTSLLLFIVPAVVVWRRERRFARELEEARKGPPAGIDGPDEEGRETEKGR